MYERGLIAKQH